MLQTSALNIHILLPLLTYLWKIIYLVWRPSAFIQASHLYCVLLKFSATWIEGLQQSRVSCIQQCAGDSKHKLNSLYSPTANKVRRSLLPWVSTKLMLHSSERFVSVKNVYISNAQLYANHWLAKYSNKTINMVISLMERSRLARSHSVLKRNKSSREKQRVVWM